MRNYDMGMVPFAATADTTATYDMESAAALPWMCFGEIDLRF